MGKCQDCKFSQKANRIRFRQNMELLECRYNPPVVTSSADGSPSSSFPSVKPEDFCSKFENR